MGAWEIEGMGVQGRQLVRHCRELPIGVPQRVRPVAPVQRLGLPPCPESVWSVGGGAEHGVEEP